MSETNFDIDRQHESVDALAGNADAGIVEIAPTAKLIDMFERWLDEREEP